MSPAGAGNAEFHGGLDARVAHALPLTADHRLPAPRVPIVTIGDVECLLGRAQRLVDSRPADRDAIAWYIEAEHAGDMPTLSALAFLAARDAPMPETLSRVT